VRIAFRVDASLGSGLGHLQRCISLALALRKLGATPVFVIRKTDIEVGPQLASFGFQTFELPAAEFRRGSLDIDDPPLAAWAGTTWRADSKDTIDVLAKSPPDWLIVDHYSFDARWHATVARAMDLCVAAIDDLADRPLDVSLLIDQNIAESHWCKYRGLLSSRTTLLGGPRFALLGPSFRDSAKYEFHEQVRSIGVFMGGVDAANLSSRVVHACREDAGFAGAIEVVTTRFNPNKSSLREFATRWPETVITEDLPDLAGFFARHDLQIGAGGGASWERAAIGAPSLLLISADNQRVVVNALARLGAAVTADISDRVPADYLGASIANLIRDPVIRKDLGERARRLVDGLGAHRVALCLLNKQLEVRPARVDDTELMYEWRNDSRTRAVSLDPALLDHAKHFDWVKQTLSNPNRCLLVGQIGQLPVGVIRFDKLHADSAEISLYLNPDLYGLGLGSALLRAGERFFSGDNKNRTEFVATVLSGNSPSEKLFESCGYLFDRGRWHKSIAFPSGGEN